MVLIIKCLEDKHVFDLVILFLFLRRERGGGLTQLSLSRRKHVFERTHMLDVLLFFVY